MDAENISLDIPPKLLSKLQDKTWIKKQLIKGKKVHQILGFSDAVMDIFYDKACGLYKNSLFSDSADAFFFLVTLNPYNQDYWLGYGSSTQRCEDYDRAIGAYEMAAICQLENPIPYFHMAKCLFAIHERESALQAIELSLEYAEGLDEFGDLYQQAKAAKSMLLKEMDKQQG